MFEANYCQQHCPRCRWWLHRESGDYVCSSCNGWFSSIELKRKDRCASCAHASPEGAA